MTVDNNSTDILSTIKNVDNLEKKFVEFSKQIKTDILKLTSIIDSIIKQTFEHTNKKNSWNAKIIDDFTRSSNVRTQLLLRNDPSRSF